MYTHPSNPTAAMDSGFGHRRKTVTKVYTLYTEFFTNNLHSKFWLLTCIQKMYTIRNFYIKTINDFFNVYTFSVTSVYNFLQVIFIMFVLDF